METKWGIPRNTEASNSCFFHRNISSGGSIFGPNEEPPTKRRVAGRTLRNEVSIATCSRNVIANVQAVRDTYVNEISHAYRENARQDPEGRSQRRCFHESREKFARSNTRGVAVFHLSSFLSSLLFFFVRFSHDDGDRARAKSTVAET